MTFCARTLLGCLFLGGAACQAQTAPPAQTPETRATEALTAAFKRADANGDGKLTREESARLPAVADRFDDYDKDGDGVLTLAELAAGMQGK